MTFLTALIFLAAAREPANFFESDLAETCGGEVFDRARVVVNADSRTVIYDQKLAPEQVHCIASWAASWRHRIVNGVRIDASPRYPLGRYEIRPELKIRR